MISAGAAEGPSYSQLLAPSYSPLPRRERCNTGGSSETKTRQDVAEGKIQRTMPAAT